MGDLRSDFRIIVAPGRGADETEQRVHGQATWQTVPGRMLLQMFSEMNYGIPVLIHQFDHVVTRTIGMVYRRYLPTCADVCACTPYH